MDQQNQTPGIKLSDTQEITCNSCQGTTFTDAVKLRRVSKFLTGTNKPGVIPIPVFKCSDCGHVNEEFLPSDLQES